MGIVITAVTSLLMGALLLYLALSFLHGKNIELIAGYSSMSESEKKECDKEKLGRKNGITLLQIAIFTLFFSLMSFLTVFGAIKQTIFVVCIPIYIVLVIVLVIISMIKLNK
ncbi:MAG: DUF3784 domain-containing protein [Oscillospiraceae bacterium]